ncbi:Hypothetical predicted protein [Cloeon dipterum]|uniref:SHC-transforming protein 1 n=1 Tax=Cloeon dipterum TaxID=197152 RepID=A0A8S1C390_9INSE|nr:Hypothetical predicted protein [Cloeon dipterum]
MSAELGKMLKCLTHRTYRSLQEDNYTPVNHAIKSEEPIKKGGSKSHSEPASTLGSPQRSGGLHGLKTAIGLRLRGLRADPKQQRPSDECASCGGGASDSSSSAAPQPASAPRYTRLPTAAAATKSRVASALQLLRRHRGAAKLLRERSKSDNSLQRLSVVHGATSRSDHALQRLLVRNGSEQHVFLPPDSPPQLPARDKKPARRSRSLERTSNFRVYPINSGSAVTSNGSRSLERNHKFRIGKSSPQPPQPQQPAPVSSSSACSARHAFPHCASCPLAAHNQEVFKAFSGSTVLLLQRPPPSMAAPPPPEPHRGGLVSRPDNGWLHSENKLAREGISYLVKYVGCLEVKTSMKSLDFETRSMIAKECINRVCEAACLKTVDKKRKVERRVSRVLADHPNMNHAGANVTLSISSKGLQLTVLDTGQLIAQHDMPNISFASGGDPDTLDFMAYVAKDANQWRACMVLECGGGMAQDVITTVGQAFEIRFKEYLRKTPNPPTATKMPIAMPTQPCVGMAMRQPKQMSLELESPATSDLEYYNDLPGKVPPDVGPPPVPPLPQYHAPSLPPPLQQQPSHGIPPPPPPPPPSENAPHPPRGSTSSNLIDLHSELSPVHKKSWEHDYVNHDVADKLDNGNDVFDMQPFSTTLTAGATSLALQRQQLEREPWFHGPISRKEAESILKNDGDFLVRESQGSPGQYVLTGLQGGVKKHLLLVDPEGVVRTKDKMFESVSHLINYHSEKNMPIISAESAIVLRRPVPRDGPLKSL